jgi:hypothetical protein
MSRKSALGAAIAMTALFATHAVATPARCAAPRAPAAIAVSVSVAPGPHGPDTPIPVKVTLANTGGALVALPDVMQPDDHWLRFEVKDAQGTLVGYTGPEFKLRYQEKGILLLPGYFWGKQFADLRQFHRLPGPGVYTIAAIYGISPVGACPLGVHRSDSATFSVR